MCNETEGDFVEIPQRNPALQKQRYLERLVQDEDGAWVEETEVQKAERQALYTAAFGEDNCPGGA